jgi:drug/metabolite transporter (DMT)-like permease
MGVTEGSAPRRPARPSRRGGTVLRRYTSSGRRSLAAGLLLTALSAICFGLQGIFANVAFDHGANVGGVIVARAAAVAPLLLLLLSAARRSRVRSAARPLAVMTAISMANTITYYVAVDRMSPGLVTLVIYVYPALAVVGSALLGWTRITSLTALALTSTITGIVLTVGLPQDAVDPLATALALLNGTMFAVWLLLAQAALRTVDPVTVFATVGGISQLVLLVGTFLVAAPAFAVDAAGLAALVAGGTVCTVLAFVLQLHGVVRLGGAATALVASLEIVTAAGLSAVVLGDPVGVGLVIGGVLVVAGAVLAPVSVVPTEAGEAVTRSRAGPFRAFRWTRAGRMPP